MNEGATLDQRLHPRRAALVAVVWAFGALPALFGVVACPIATLAHAPCPGCGMTRAMRALIAGDVAASLRMHPFAVPSIVATAAVMLATVGMTYTRGSPILLLKARAGRWVAAAFVLVNVAIFLFWAMRMLGWFGGRVPV